ncbi:hypothetical protein [Tenacibaculum amylolyticum]|uniref:hypothetical protein n=1 Tax=Tenacibaculum amylolyticum TaxID=104269 RepID=UPI0038953D25
MIRILLSLTLCALTCIGYAQDASVEKSINGIQVGFLGAWAHREMKLSNEVALRIELGMDAGGWSGNYTPKSSFAMVPVLTLEPRWYYNLNKRASKSKDISRNSANFFTLQTSYHPDWFVISNNKSVRVNEQISIIPTWGIRRNLGKNFNYEAGIGIGYRHVIPNGVFRSIDPNIHLRIGYQF